MAALLVFTSCEEEKPAVEKADQTSLLSGKELMAMTPEEQAEYFAKIDVSQLKPGYTKTWTDTLSADEFAKYRSIISLRASEKCGVVVTAYIYPGGPDSADVTVYEAGTSTVYRAKERLADGDDFWMEIDGADEYDFVTAHPNNPSGSISGYLEIDPDWGGKTLAFFSDNGSHTYPNYNFVCPPESMDGTCDAYISVFHKSGTATNYNVIATHSGSPIPILIDQITGNPTQSKSFTCDENEIYNFFIYSNGGANESFDVSIIRPDGIAHGYNLYNRDMSNQTVNTITLDFDYFECPY